MSEKSRKQYAMSRGRRTALFMAFVLAMAVGVWLDRSGVAQKWRGEPDDFSKYRAKVFTVVKIVDGDTIDIDVADGEYEHTRIRLWGIDTPETKSSKYGVMYYGLEAAQFTSELAQGEDVTVYLDDGNRTRGKYGRLLAYVRLPDGRFLNEVLVSEGYAYADLRFRHSLYNRYKQLEGVARRQQKGLWEEVTREQLPKWLQRKKPKLLVER